MRRKRALTTRQATIPALVLALSGVLLAGCTSGDGASAPTGPSATTTTAAPTPSTTRTGTPLPAVDCTPRDGVTIRRLPDVRIPAVTVAEQVVPAVSVGGQQVAAVTVPGFTVPAAIVDGGCVVDHDAPGGCAGAVEISAVFVPAATIPRSVLPATALPGGKQAPELALDAVTAPAVSAPAVRVPQVCQVATSGKVATVTRPGVVRPALSRPGVARSGATRPQVCVSSGDCYPAVAVPAVHLEPVRVASVDVDPMRLQRKELAAGVTELPGDRTTSYISPGDVLFDTGQDTLRRGARKALRVIADELEGSSGTVLVEGHTDDRGTAEYNLALSRRRAQAVADWLREDGGVRKSRLVVRGLGESAPAYTNGTEAGRQGNRRVVVSVSR